MTTEHENERHEWLNDEHLAQLRASGIADDVILERGYRSEPLPGQRERKGGPEPGLILPLWTVGGDVAFFVRRPDAPRVNGQGKPIKYEIPQGERMRLDCLPRCRSHLGDPAVPLWITEGQKKADALASRGLCAIALLGVWNWRGKNALGGTTVLADWECVHLKGRDVRVVYDSDVMTKAPVQQALARLEGFLESRGAQVRVAYLPDGREGKTGVDDWLVAGHTVAELEGLLEPLRPATSSSVEWCDGEPPILGRPLALVDGHGYAATWIWCHVTRQDDDAPPEVTDEYRLIVVRDDGVAFGPGGDHPLAELPLMVHLGEVPPAESLWSCAGVQRFRGGERPDPAEVFARLKETVGAFVDFDRSLTDQVTMTELVACHILSTYVLDALPVTGFLWCTGEAGSGKTQLIDLHTRLSYLGTLLLQGGSYATLRDLADYGATLAFDDAENVADSRKMDPDKQALILAGNRRGVTVSLKELGPEKTWRTRRVNAYTTRLFSAIRRPDPVLASRSIVIPLVRTSDRTRANHHPADLAHWPHPRQRLVDDLWALGTEHLPAMPEHVRAATGLAHLVGRALEPWVGILAVADWLEKHGVVGLYGRMEALSREYDRSREDVQTDDLTLLVIRALGRCAAGDAGECVVTTSQVTDAVEALAREDEQDLGWMPDHDGRVRRVGHKLSSLRLKRVSRPGGKGGRRWAIGRGELAKLLGAYGLPLPEGVSLRENGPNGTMAQPVSPVGVGRDA